MTLFSDIFLQGNSIVSLPDRKLLYYTSSGTFTAPYNMDVIIDDIGAGASGALRAGSVPGNASGGGAGGHVKKRVSLKAGDVLTITIGAGGVQRTVSAADVTAGFARYDGNDGGNSTVTGPNGLNLVAGGGKGGKNSALNVAALGGLGGTATGGDVNLPGGRGGNIAARASATGNNSTAAQASGGGAVDVLALGAFHGGDLSAVGTNPAANFVSATPGAGVGEHGGGDAGSLSPFNSAGGGVGLLYPGLGIAATILPDRTVLGLFSTIGPVGGLQTNGTPSNISQPGPLCGGGSAINYGASAGVAIAGTGGTFAGGGAAAQSNSVSSSAVGFGGAGGLYGGGGGGASSIFATVNSTTTGKGSDGLVVLELLA